MADHCAVVFDLDDTLHAERRFVLSGLRHVAGLIATETGLPVADVFRTAVAAFRRGERRDVLQAVCRAHRLPEGAVTPWVEALRAHTPDLRLRADVRDVLTGLRAEGRRLGILTNGLPQVQQRKVVALGLLPLVDAVVYADAVVAGGKPHPAAFAAVLAALGVSAGDAVMVGDAPREDIAGARAAGLRTILLGHHRRTGQADETAAADARIDDIAQLPAVIRRLERTYARAC